MYIYSFRLFINICSYWFDENFHIDRESIQQHHGTMGPLFIKENITGKCYQDLLLKGIIYIIIRVAQEEENLIKQELVFLQDGAPPFYYVRVRKPLDQIFPERRIGRRGSIK